MPNNLDMRSVRDKIGLTQSQLAAAVGLDPARIVRWENGSEPSSSELLTIMDRLGLSLEELTGFKRTSPDALDVKNEWAKFRNLQSTLVSRVQSTLDKWTQKDPSILQPLEYLLHCLQSAQKPSIAVVGGIEAGKSTIINAFLGKQKLPTAYGKCTRAVIYLKHISDRPDFLRDTVSIFKRGEPIQPLWDVSRINDKDYCSSWLLASGDMDLLAEYGTYEGSKSSENVSAIVIFLDSSLLQDVDLIDCPGFFADSDRIDPLVMSALRQASMMLYLSPSNNFLCTEDVIYLQKAMQILPVYTKAKEHGFPPLHNLFVIASRAHMGTGKSQRDLDELLDTQCSLLYSTLPKEDYWTARAQASGYDAFCENDLRSCFFAYTTNSPSLCSALHQKLQKTIETLTAATSEGYRCFIHSFVKDSKSKAEQVLSLMDKDSKIENSGQQSDNSNDPCCSILNSISKYEEACGKEITDIYTDMVNISNIANKISNSNLQNKKSDIQKFVTQMQQEFQMKCDECVHKQLNNLNEAIANASQTAPITFVPEKYHLIHSNTASALAIAQASGASAAIASSLIAGSSLGGIVSVSSAVFAPTMLPVLLAATSAISATRAFTGNWQKNAARKISNIFKNSHTQEKCLSANKKFWARIKAQYNTAFHQQQQQNTNTTKAQSLTAFSQRKQLLELKEFLSEISLWSKRCISCKHGSP